MPFATEFHVLQGTGVRFSAGAVSDPSPGRRVGGKPARAHRAHHLPTHSKPNTKNDAPQSIVLADI